MPEEASTTSPPSSCAWHRRRQASPAPAGPSTGALETAQAGRAVTGPRIDERAAKRGRGRVAFLAVRCERDRKNVVDGRRNGFADRVQGRHPFVKHTGT